MIVPGTILGSRYRIESHLGGGNMGDVYTARHTSTGRQFAVKVLRNHLVRNDLAREKFATEVQVGAVIGESHHIVEVSDAGFDAEHGVPYLVMPLLRGEALDAMIARGPLAPELVLRLMRHLARALDQAHAANVVHRDIKPSNLFVVRDHEGLPLLKVLDFGIAKVMSAQGDMTATELGTPAYRAPEQLAPMFKQLARGSGVNIASNVSSATDVWALALAVYECLTGHAACQVWSVQSVQELSLRVLQPAPVPSRIAGAQASLLPRGFDSWFSWCVERDASRRCQRASEAVAALEALYVAASEQSSEQSSAVGTSLGAAVPSYHPDKAPDMARIAQETPRTSASAARAKQTSLAGAVETYAAGVSGAGMTTGGAGVSTQAVDLPSHKRRAAIAVAAGVGLVSLVGVVVWAGSGKDSPDVPAATPPSVSARPAPVETVQQAEIERVGASVKIPAGSFRRGSDDGESDERPTERMEVKAFEMDIDEVTVGRFASCVKKGACEAQSSANGKAVGEGKELAYWSSQCNWGRQGREKHPMNCVDWKQASGFCAWVGKRLATEVEWEYAACGGDKELQFPWGGEAPTTEHANGCGPECTEPLNAVWSKAGKSKRLIPVFETSDGHEGTSEVGAFRKGVSPLGMRDMAGNVWEWTSSRYCTYGTENRLSKSEGFLAQILPRFLDTVFGVQARST